MPDLALDTQPACDTTRSLRLSEAISTLSYALDLTEGQPPGHCLRCGWIGMRIGRHLGLDAVRAVRPVLYAAAEGCRLQ